VRVGGDAAVILYDEDGGLIAGRSDALRQAVGEMEFFVLKGGLQAWRDAGLPVEGG
jgi:3-mercaptopyruvate sulfurtransferase SseA